MSFTFPFRTKTRYNELRRSSSEQARKPAVSISVSGNPLRPMAADSIQGVSALSCNEVHEQSIIQFISHHDTGTEQRTARDLPRSPSSHTSNNATDSLSFIIINIIYLFIKQLHKTS